MPQELTYTEAELLRGLQLHDEQAYSFLYDHYSKALFSIIYQVIPQQEIAEDVLQEAFIKIWQNIASYDSSKGRLFTWMLNICRNQAIDRTRSKELNNQTKTISLSDSVYDDRQAVNTSVDDIGLKKTINKLPAENKRILDLAYYQGFTQDEISKILNIPLGTVKTRIRTTLIQLRKILGRD